MTVLTFRLGDIAEQITDGTHLSPNYVDSGIPMLDSKHIKNDFSIDDSDAEKFISIETDQQLALRCKPIAGDILISSRGTIGKIAIVKVGQNFNIMGNTILIRLGSSIDKRFFLHYLRRSLEHLVSLARGVAQKGLYLNQVRDLIIKIPSLAEQQRIATQLDTADHILKLRESTITKLDQLAQSTFVDMSSQTKNIFAVKKLGDVCDVRDGTHDSPKYVNDGIPLVTSKNLANGFIDLSNVNLISNSDFVEINKRSKVDCGDILMPMIGTIGNPVIVHDKKPQFAIKNVALIKTLKMSPSPIYIKAVLESSYFHSYVEKISRGGTQKFLGLGDIRKFEIALMKKNIEDDFVIFMNKLKAMKDLFLKNVLKNQELIASLQHQSFELNLHEQL